MKSYNFWASFTITFDYFLTHFVLCLHFRYTLIVTPSRYRRWYGRPQTRVQLALIWLVPLVLVCLPLVDVWGHYSYHPNIYSCSFDTCSEGQTNASYVSYRSVWVYILQWMPFQLKLWIFHSLCWMRQNLLLSTWTKQSCTFDTLALTPKFKCSHSSLFYEHGECTRWNVMQCSHFNAELCQIAVVKIVVTSKKSWILPKNFIFNKFSFDNIKGIWKN